MKMKKRISSIFLTATITMSSLVNPANAMTGGTEGTNPWMNTKLSAEERTELLLDKMTMEQKIQQIATSRFNENDTGKTVVINNPYKATKYRNGEFAPQGTLPGCEFQDTGRQIRGIDELGIPNIRMTNSGTGVKGGSCVDHVTTGLPSTLAMSASFDRELNYEAGRILGEEARAFAHQVILGPSMNLLRHPYGGRAYEYFSEDPYLTGTLAIEQTKGIQDQGVQVQLKHLAGNEQESRT